MEKNLRYNFFKCAGIYGRFTQQYKIHDTQVGVETGTKVFYFACQKQSYCRKESEGCEELFVHKSKALRS